MGKSRNQQWTLTFYKEIKLTAKQQLEELIDTLQPYRPALTGYDDNITRVICTVDANSYETAHKIANIIVAATLDPILGIEIIPTEMHQYRAATDFETMTALDKALCTVTEAAETANVSRQSILKAISDGRLNAVKIGPRWLIPNSAVAAYAAERQEAQQDFEALRSTLQRLELGPGLRCAPRRGSIMIDEAVHLFGDMPTKKASKRGKKE